MRPTTHISIVVDTELKKNSDKIFSELGMTASQALRMFLSQVVIQQKIPFDLTLSGKKEGD